MNAKKVSMKPKPSITSSDDWVSQGKESVKEKEVTEKIKRLTIDIPESLHRIIKAQCASRGNKIVDEIRELLEKKYRSDNG